MDIVDYIKKKNTEKTDKKDSAPKTPQEALKKYAGYTEEQMMRELFRYGSLSTGRISAQELDDFFAKVSPYLSTEQSERMQELIISLKNS